MAEVEVEAPPAPSEAPPDGIPVVEPEAEQADEQRRTLKQRVARLVPAPIAGGWRAFASWSHTRPALRLGAVLLVVGGVAAAVSLFVIGVLGVGTSSAPGYGGVAGVPVSSSGGTLIGPPYLPSGQSSSIVSAALASMVVQPADLPSGMELQDQGATGGDSDSGLLGSYHTLYQRSRTASGDAGSGQPVAVFSFVGAYSDIGSAQTEMSQVSLDQLGVEAGLPQLTGTAVASPLVGDDTRALHLTGRSGATDVGAYVVEFRDGSMTGVVGAVWPQGQESLDFVLGLARAQDAHITAGRQPVQLPDLAP